jgi:hydroxypyruvate reductase
MLVDRALREPGGRPTHAIAVGKAAAAMAVAAAERLGDRIVKGLVVAPAIDGLPKPFEGIAARHPVPDASSEKAGRRALALAAGTRSDERLLVLLSGGASALMAVPAEGVALEDKQAATRLLLQHGADIHSLNTVRKHLSAIKGGRLAAAARAECVTLAVSDVVDDDVSVIGSGPTVADASTFAEAMDVLERLGGAAGYPRAVVERLLAGRRGEIAETPKPGDPRVEAATVEVIGTRRHAMEGAAAEGRRRGYDVRVIDEPIVGEARDAAPGYAGRVLEAARHAQRPTCLVSSGETTVHVKGGGAGGRNQELALALVACGGLPGGAWLAASVGTDGVDGPTDAAGAIAGSDTLRLATERRLDPHDFLRRNDAYNFFNPLGDLVRTGPTGTNVGDLQIVLLP